MFELATHLALVLVLAAFLAGFVDAIAGGGGLVTVPALLLCGASPVEALATNKLQGTFGSATAAVAYARAGIHSKEKVAHLMLIAASLERVAGITPVLGDVANDC